MTFADLKTYVALALGNIKAGDPYYDTLLGWAVNSAVREVPKRRLAVKADYNQFPELNTHWRDVTVNGTHEYALPANALVIYSMYSLDDSTTFPGEGAGSSRQIIWSEPQSFELLDRDVEGYPRNWTMGGTNIKIWPTPTTSYLTYFRIYGLKLEADMSSASATPTLREHWHNAVVFYAAYLLAGMKGWKDRSDHFYKMFMEAIGAAIDPTAVLLSHQDGSVDIIGDPTRN